jgi:hypothetical protein
MGLDRGSMAYLPNGRKKYLHRDPTLIESIATLRERSVLVSEGQAQDAKH